MISIVLFITITVFCFTASHYLCVIFKILYDRVDTKYNGFFTEEVVLINVYCVTIMVIFYYLTDEEVLNKFLHAKKACSSVKLDCCVLLYILFLSQNTDSDQFFYIWNQ